MSSYVEDLQMLRLIKAFQQITDQEARRIVVLSVEEQLEKQQAKARQKPWRTEH
ncbi:hypothetical protein [Bradyrhizobium sp. NAS80.1]|uniref:hypothetical protein n=1 Tax=Bradyrhizobium sp. NAS80.1 TaxID=1680159 RepID=UPI00143D43CF|nr:hypothetical protein [Bradyrhizobium sp. NAS80.1]